MALQDEFSVQLRLPRDISEGDVVEVKAKIKHPVRTGLQLIETAQTPYERFIRNQPAEFVKKIEVYLDGELISTFDMNSSTSDDPLVAFMVRADKEADLRVVVTNHLNDMVEATETIAFSLE